VTGFEHVAILAGVSAVAFLGIRWDARRRPYAPCLFCKKRRGRNPGSTGRAWGRCLACKGTGERRRLVSRIFAGRKGGE
jgi:hypothetical protein